MTGQLSVLGRDVTSLTSEESKILGNMFVGGDIAALDAQGKWDYTKGLCERLGLDPYTQPFGLIKGKDGKLKLYAKKETAEQLIALYDVTCDTMKDEWKVELGIYIVYAKAIVPATATKPERSQTARGVVSLTDKNGALTGEDLANAIMKAETKARRRATLAALGLSFLDTHKPDDADVQDISAPPVKVSASRAKSNQRAAEKKELNEIELKADDTSSAIDILESDDDAIFADDAQEVEVEAEIPKQETSGSNVPAVASRSTSAAATYSPTDDKTAPPPSTTPPQARRQAWSK